jgi:2-C-methyl-D-erythritol 4-phosphate cytidylyltransferase
MSGHVAAIIAAAGSGVRFGADIPKALIQLGNRTLIEHAVAAISPAVDQVIVTAPASHLSQFKSLLGEAVTVVAGGSTRSESIRAGLAAVTSDMQYVLIHDAARALASTDLTNPNSSAKTSETPTSAIKLLVVSYLSPSGNLQLRHFWHCLVPI